MTMKETILQILFIHTIFFSFIYTYAQGKSNPSIKLHRNSINTYASLGDYNINYERNILQRPKSYSNLRMGFGKDQSYLIGYYINPCLAHLIGKMNSHLELNLGVKILVGPQAIDASAFLPEIYAGYRYEKPEGRFIFRAGFNLATFYSIGIGVKF